MHTFAVEARRTEDGPWMPVTTVQDDLVADAAQMIMDGPIPGEWRIRALHESGPLVQAPRETVKITRWDRLKWWAMMRFSRRAHR